MICWREHQHRVCTDSQHALPAANGQSSDGQHGSVKGQCRCQGAFQLLELSEAGLRLTLTVSRGWLQPVGKLTGCRPPANGQGKGQHPRGKQACCPLAGHTPQLCQHQRHAQTKTIGQTDRQTDRNTHANRSMDAARDNSTRCLSLSAKQTNAYHYSTAACKWGRCMMIW